MKETWGILIVITHKPTTKSREGKHKRCGFSTMKEEHGERGREGTNRYVFTLVVQIGVWTRMKNVVCDHSSSSFFLGGWSCLLLICVWV